MDGSPPAIGADSGTVSARTLLLDLSSGEELVLCELDDAHGVIGNSLPGTGERLPEGVADAGIVPGLFGYGTGQPAIGDVLACSAALVSGGGPSGGGGVPATLLSLQGAAAALVPVQPRPWRLVLAGPTIRSRRQPRLTGRFSMSIRACTAHW
ncbi:MAG: hypothetical protein ACP5VR_08200, partial [Acidimicrobiales bacterium]